MSDTNSDHKVGDVLVKFGKLYKIFKIKQQQDEEATQDIAYYKPVFVKSKREEMICSIPLSNISGAMLRRPIEKSKFEVFLNNLVEKKDMIEEKLQIKTMGDLVHSEDLEQKSKIIAHLWMKKQDPEVKVSTSEFNFLNELIESVAEELAFAYDLDPKSAQEEIISKLES